MPVLLSHPGLCDTAHPAQCQERTGKAKQFRFRESPNLIPNRMNDFYSGLLFTKMTACQKLWVIPLTLLKVRMSMKTDKQKIEK